MAEMQTTLSPELAAAVDAILVAAGDLAARTDQQTVYTVHEVADIAKVHRGTVWRWIRAGELRAERYGKHSYRVTAAALRQKLAAA